MSNFTKRPPEDIVKDYLVKVLDIPIYNSDSIVSQSTTYGDIFDWFSSRGYIIEIDLYYDMVKEDFLNMYDWEIVDVNADMHHKVLSSGYSDTWEKAAINAIKYLIDNYDNNEAI